MKVGVLGARGKVGAEVCRAVEAADDLELVARVDAGRRRLAEPGRAPAREAVVDFTHPDVVMDNLRVLHRARHPRGGRHHRLRRRAGSTGCAAGSPTRPGTGVLVAPNFSIGAILMMRFAAQAAPFYESVEIVELHHPDKADAPVRHRPAYGGADRRRPPRGRPRRRCPTRPRTALEGARGADVDGDPRARAADPRPGRAPGGHPRRRGGDADDPPRLARPGLVHARRAAGLRAIGDRPGLTVGLEHFLDLG